MPKSELAPSSVTMQISCIGPVENSQGRLCRGRPITVKCDIREIPVSTLVDEEKKQEPSVLLLFDEKNCYEGGGALPFNFK